MASRVLLIHRSPARSREGPRRKSFQIGYLGAYDSGACAGKWTKFKRRLVQPTAGRTKNHKRTDASWSADEHEHCLLGVAPSGTSRPPLSCYPAPRKLAPAKSCLATAHDRRRAKLLRRTSRQRGTMLRLTGSGSVRHTTCWASAVMVAACRRPGRRSVCKTPLRISSRCSRKVR